MSPAGVTSSTHRSVMMRCTQRSPVRGRVHSRRIFGFPSFDGDLYNACAICADGEVQAYYRKRFLPNYGVFDEKRVFTPGPLPEPVAFRNMRVGLPICEDVWYPECVAHLSDAGAQLLLVPNGSPFSPGRLTSKPAAQSHRGRAR